MPPTPSTSYALLPPHLRYALTADDTAVELEIEVFGYLDGDPAAERTAHALSILPAINGWTDPAGGPPRFGLRELITDERHTTHPVLADPHARAVIAAY
ncbi:hypothetical protein ACQPXB_08465 [Amycolatopsis sp. CA-161197]|uniref:hypothetical protein n=1 Tax=Amycolatopsis sp. CA-161197 TaxID=3239922 RepID=UPI003D924950